MQLAFRDIAPTCFTGNPLENHVILLNCCQNGWPCIITTHGPPLHAQWRACVITPVCLSYLCEYEPIVYLSVSFLSNSWYSNLLPTHIDRFSSWRRFGLNGSRSSVSCSKDRHSLHVLQLLPMHWPCRYPHLFRPTRHGAMLCDGSFWKHTCRRNWTEMKRFCISFVSCSRPPLNDLS
jgi:hypothetical protein